MKINWRLAIFGGSISLLIISIINKNPYGVICGFISYICAIIDDLWEDENEKKE